MVTDDKAQLDEIEKGTYICPICGHVSINWLDSQVHIVDHIDELK